MLKSCRGRNAEDKHIMAELREQFLLAREHACEQSDTLTRLATLIKTTVTGQAHRCQINR